MFKRIFALLIAFCLVLPFAACKTTEEPTYALVFDTDIAGVTESPIVATAGSAITLPTPNAAGYRFDGWFRIDNDTAFTDTVMPQANLTLKAKWTKLYTISFDSDGGSHVDAIEAVSGTAITAPTSPTREGYGFVCWQLNGVDYVFGTMPDENITLTALWSDSVTLSFVTGVAGLTVPDITLAAGQPVSAPQVLRAGFALRYWRTSDGQRYTFSTMPSTDLTLYAEWIEATTNPAMFIDLFDAQGNQLSIDSVVRDKDTQSGDAYVDALITLTNTDNRYLIDAASAVFKGRGNGSWTSSGPKKGYRIKFDSSQGLLGSPKSKHWVILACTNFDDRTLARNYTAFNMAREVMVADDDGIEYVSSANWVDIYFNGSYYGVYLLAEHVRVDSNRVDIDWEYATTANGLLPQDTGFMVEYDSYAEGTEGIDYFRSDYRLKYPFTVAAPDPEDFRGEGVSESDFRAHVAYVKSYIDDVMNAALNGDFATFSQLADVTSFADMYILHELFKNTDTGWSSLFMYKRAGGKLIIGPPWDFDATAGGGRSDHPDGQSPYGWYVTEQVWQGSDYTASEMYTELMKNNSFKSAVITRWNELSPAMKAYVERSLAESFISDNKSAMAKNFVYWNPRYGRGSITQSAAETEWSNATRALRTWLLDRINWINGQWD